jgi:hypothetical protein
MARVASGGFSGMIDAHGRWTARATPPDPAAFGPGPAGWRPRVLDAALPAPAEPTVYAETGGRWGLALYAALLAGALAAVATRRR